MTTTEIVRKMIQDARKDQDNSRLRRIAHEVRQAVAKHELNPVSAFNLLDEIIDSMIL
jgi:hypothetical protein